jgi:CubicO group peptidase (beta-lactamase class C family)
MIISGYAKSRLRTAMKRDIRTALLLLLLLLAARSTSAEPIQVETLVVEEMDRQQLVGVAIGLIQDEKIIYLRGFGYADREEAIPVDTDTMFRLASISKTLTAITALQLREKGKLDLDVDIRHLVPGFPGQKHNGNEVIITPRQLLCHQGGIVHYTNGPVIPAEREYWREHPFRNVRLAVDNFSQSPLVNGPREKFSYTTRGYILLSAAIQQAGGQRFSVQVHQRIAHRCGMTSLQPDYQWKKIPNRAVGYKRVDDKIVRSTDTDVSWKLGGGGFISNIGDLARYGVGLLEGKLVLADTEKLMWTAQSTADGTPTSYGLGFQVTSMDDRTLIGHGGAQEKTRTVITLDPERGTGVVVMSNSEFANPKSFVDILLPLLSSSE